MKNFSKAGLLIVTLVIPALIFVFLKFFARNHYDLPYFNPQKDAKGNIVIENGDTLFHKITDNCPLVNEKFDGKLTVISTLPKECNEDCKLLMEELQRVDALRSEIPNLRLVILSEAGALNGNPLPAAIGSAYWGLSENTRSVIDSCFDNALDGTRGATKGDLQNMLMLVDMKGYTRGYYNGIDPAEMDRLMAEIKILDYETK
jgi:protein SCO1/2